jgi:multidrug efflux pump subunit AcrB
MVAPGQFACTTMVLMAKAYRNLGREEDPAFAIKTMVVQANWPGATIQDTLDQVTDRIEKELQQINAVDYTKSRPWCRRRSTPPSGTRRRSGATAPIRRC